MRVNSSTPSSLQIEGSSPKSRLITRGLHILALLWSVRVSFCALFGEGKGCGRGAEGWPVMKWTLTNPLGLDLQVGCNHVAHLL